MNTVHDHKAPSSTRQRGVRLAPAAIALAFALLVAGCASIGEPFVVDRATPAPQTASAEALKQLPPPQEPIVVAVYRFRDQTGQYRALENMSTFSTAVTQGTTSILVRALEDSGWFIPIEREGLSNLLNERQIIQGIRAQHVGPDGEPLGPLPPLLYAGVILEGGVIGYDTNVITSGAGLRYFGAGGSGAVRQDQVTIYLRAVSTQSGRVLKTVYTTKTILSQRVEGGIFRYVALRRLLEAEAGYSFNEPPVVAVTEAIEEAVRSLVIEGVRDNLWGLANPGDVTHPAFAEYDRAVREAETTDAFGRLLQAERPNMAVGASAGMALYQGDYQNPLARPAGSILFRYHLTPRFALGLSAGAGQLAADRAFEATHAQADMQGVFTFLPNRPVSPYLSAGFGLLVQPDPPRATQSNALFPYATIGGGLEIGLTNRLILLAGGSFDYALVHGLDGVQVGRIHDSLFNVRTGLLYYTNL
jgi:curli production assembly/transport component CsgG